MSREEDILRIIRTYDRQSLTRRFKGQLKEELRDELEAILNEHYPASAEEKVVVVQSESPTQVGDIYYRDGVYYIGGLDSPMRIAIASGRGRALRLFLQNIDKRISISQIAQVSGLNSVQASMNLLKQDIEFCSLEFVIEKLGAEYRMSSDSLIADPKSTHPDFQPQQVNGNIHIGEEMFYIGTSNCGVYGIVGSWEDHFLKLLLEKPNENITLPDKRRGLTSLTDKIMFTLMRKINNYSIHYEILAVDSGKLIYRLQPRQS